MSSPLPFMVRRARLIRGETQRDFAIHMGVDQATVSRWERSKSEATPANFAEIRRIIATAEPSYSLDYVRAAPTIKYMCAINDFSKTVAASTGLLEALGVDREEAIDGLIATADEAERVAGTVIGDPRWLAGRIAFFEANFKAHHRYGENRWFRTIGAPLSEAKAMLWEGVLVDDPLDFMVKLTPFTSSNDDA